MRGKYNQPTLNIVFTINTSLFTINTTKQQARSYITNCKTSGVPQQNATSRAKAPIVIHMSPVWTRARFCE